MKLLALYFIQFKSEIWSSRFFDQQIVLTLSISLFRHYQCEMDANCPYLVLLECIENEISCEAVDNLRLEWVDQHFTSYLHGADFDSDKKQRNGHLTERSRRTMNIGGINMDVASSNRNLTNRLNKSTFFGKTMSFGTNACFTAL